MHPEARGITCTATNRTCLLSAHSARHDADADPSQPVPRRCRSDGHHPRGPAGPDPVLPADAPQLCLAGDDPPHTISPPPDAQPHAPLRPHPAHPAHSPHSTHSATAEVFVSTQHESATHRLGQGSRSVG